MLFHSSLQRLETQVPGVSLYQVTDGKRPTIHRFYDTSPVSPSGRYIALTEFPFDDRLPEPGDAARVYVLDLRCGQEVYSSNTSAWDTQVGAHVQWGSTDGQLFFNRMDEERWVPYGVRVNIVDGHEVRLDHTVYMVSPNGLSALSPCLRKIGLVQPGYGVCVPPGECKGNDGAPDDDGIYIVDTTSGRARLLSSLSNLARQIGLSSDLLQRGGLYGFHVKWSPDGDRIMCILRLLSKGRAKTLNYLLTMDADGGGVRLALGPEAWEGGHHPNWCPDGQSIVMNLLHPRAPRWRMRVDHFVARVARKARLRYFPKSRRLSFARIAADGSGIELVSARSIGSGHPTIDPSGRILVTDAYPEEEVAFPDCTVPIRAIFLADDREECLIRIDTKPRFVGRRSEYRIDPHPAWDGSGNYLTINGAVGGCRSVFVADLSGMLEREASRV